MLISTEKRTGVALLCSFMFITSVLAPVALAGKSAPVVVVEYEVSGNAVLVSVKNTTHKPQTCEVHVYATLDDGTEVKGFTPVTLSSRGDAETLVGFSQTIENVDSVGIIDQADPW